MSRYYGTGTCSRMIVLRKSLSANRWPLRRDTRETWRRVESSGLEIPMNRSGAQQPLHAEHARRQHAGAPHDGGRQVGDLEPGPRHFAKARRERRDRAQRTEEAADEDRRQAAATEERDAAHHQGLLPRQRPKPHHAALEPERHLVGEPLRRERAQDRAEQCRPDRQSARPEHGADGEQNRHERHPHRNEGERLAEREREQERRRPPLVILDERNRLPRELVHPAPTPWRTGTS